ncbi:heavy-metal-associated domain-containing protein [Acetonema longum]|uniref:ATPase P n=1 Tax=Acetonema longum DSM 6540 TaxID=1009370 RepID=F7NGN3_9FIRM|nr:heavy metal-associated domain-containing protein [Acetonema longum]EGO64837.1 ATPase P [Acetonema longum DSM 6540]
MSQSTLKISGMKCARCAARVENALLSLPGVEQAKVDFSTATASVEGDVSQDQVVTVIETLGYDVAGS